jgi:hypothetical protein
MQSPLPRKTTLIVIGGFISVAVAMGLLVRRSESREWGVLLSALPDKITTQSITNSVYYILKQTHQPVFRKDDGQNFTSELLTYWDRNADSTIYTLCPNTDLQFDSSRRFSLAFFGKYLRNVTKKFAQGAVISERGGCCRVSFPQSRFGYMDYLSAYDNSPSMENGVYELGLGPFRVSNISADRITLVRKDYVPYGYNEITLFDYKGAADPNLNNRNIKDFNRISAFDVPEWVKKDFLSFNNLGLKSEVLIINVADEETRKIIYNCFDVDTFRRAFVPKKKDFYDIQTVFPLGVPGAKVGLPPRDSPCKKIALKAQKPIVLANWRKDNFFQLQTFVDDFYRRTGVPIKIVNYDANKLAASIDERPRPYNLLVILLSAMTSEYVDFLSPFFGNKSYLDFEIAAAKQDYQQLLREDVPARKEALAERIADELAKNHAVLTLYQGNDTVYYPKEIKNLVVGSDFMEYPEVADFRW